MIYKAFRAWVAKSLTSTSLSSFKASKTGLTTFSFVSWNFVSRDGKQEKRRRKRKWEKGGIIEGRRKGKGEEREGRRKKGEWEKGEALTGESLEKRLSKADAAPNLMFATGSSAKEIARGRMEAEITPSERAGLTFSMNKRTVILWR
jgi:hypothetical protein